jgi:hypothetical protein
MTIEIDPKSWWICAVPFVAEDGGAGKNYWRGKRCRGDDPYVQLYAQKGMSMFVPEDEASSDALSQAYSQHWNQSVEPRVNAAAMRAENIAVGTRLLPSDSLCAVSAKKIVAANDQYELAFDEHGAVIGARLTQKAFERAQVAAGANVVPGDRVVLVEEG